MEFEIENQAVVQKFNVFLLHFGAIMDVGTKGAHYDTANATKTFAFGLVDGTGILGKLLHFVIEGNDNRKKIKVMCQKVLLIINK